MSGDGRNRPTLLLQCMCFHVFFSCEHRDGLLLGLRLGHHKHQEEATLGGGPSGHQGVHRWGVSMSRSGESYVSVVTPTARTSPPSLAFSGRITETPAAAKGAAHIGPTHAALTVVANALSNSSCTPSKLPASNMLTTAGALVNTTQSTWPAMIDRISRSTETASVGVANW